MIEKEEEEEEEEPPQSREKYLAELVHGSRGTAVCHRGYDSSTLHCWDVLYMARGQQALLGLVHKQSRRVQDILPAGYLAQ